MFESKQAIDELTYEIIGSAIEVHKSLGPGLLESVYQLCLCKEFQTRGLLFESQLVVPVSYKGLELDTQLRCDFLIEKRVVLEIKSMESMLPVHEAQLLTYMKLLEVPKDVLVNFNVSNIFKEGQKTMVNDLYRRLV